MITWAAASFCVVGWSRGNVIVTLSCVHTHKHQSKSQRCTPGIACQPTLNTSRAPTYTIRRQDRAAGLHSPRVQFGPTGVDLLHQGLLRRTGAHGADAVQGARFFFFFYTKSISPTDMTNWFFYGSPSSVHRFALRVNWFVSRSPAVLECGRSWVQG